MSLSSLSSLSAVPSWSTQRVKSWFVEHGHRDVLFLHQIEKRKIDGKLLLRLNQTQMRLLLSADRRVPAHYRQSVPRDITHLQQRYRRVTRDSTRQRTNSDIRTQRQTSQPSQSRSDSGEYYAKHRGKVQYNTDNSGLRWHENEMRAAFFMFKLQKKNFREIAVALRRTETAVLTKINLIRRAFKETDLVDVRNPFKSMSPNLRNISIIRYFEKYFNF